MVHKRKVAVVVDSSSCLPRALLEEWDIYTVPHELVIQDRTFEDGIDMGAETFYQLLQRDHISPTTSAPTPGRFLDVFRMASSVADNLVCITIASNFSSTHQAATTAATMAQAELSCGITVVDSQAAAGAQGLIALEAARKAARDEGLQQVLNRVDRLIPEVNLLAFLDTLVYLRRSGRVPRLAAWAGSILGVRPLTELKMGEARLLGKPRSRARALEKLLDLAKDRAGGRPVNVNVMHAHAADDAEVLRCRVESALDCRDLFVSEFTPVMGAHLGPGLVGLAFHTVEEDLP